jgi:hypothetical protein
VPAHSAEAAVAPVVVARALREPGADGLRRRPAGAAAPEEVLAVGPRRVHQRAVAAPGLGVPPRVRRHALVPRQRRQPHRRARSVLLRQELPPELAVAAAGVRGGIAEEKQRDAEEQGDGEVSSAAGRHYGRRSSAVLRGAVDDSSGTATLLAHGSLHINIHGGTELRGGEGVMMFVGGDMRHVRQ